MDKDSTIESLYKPESGILLLAIESRGKAHVWRRFTGNYGDNTWSNSGYNTDGLVFIPQKDISLCGFSLWAPKDEPKCQIKYRVEIDNVTVLDVNSPVE